MKVLYDMINERSLSEWKSGPITGDNFPHWEKHWFDTAQALKADFESDGLPETAKAIGDIIAVQMRYKSRKPEPVSVQKEEPTPILKSPTGFENEDVLPDDYPIYREYWYVCDGKPFRNVWYHHFTVHKLKIKEGFREVRRCNLVARRKAFLEGK